MNDLLKEEMKAYLEKDMFLELYKILENEKRNIPNTKALFD